MFAATSLNLAVVSRLVAQLLRPGSTRGPHGKHLFRVDDAPSVTVTSDEPVGLQMDGDYVGAWSPVVFTSVPGALRVLV